MNIRRAEARDISRIAEILVFVKRLNFLHIFNDYDYSFGELQVLRVAEELSAAGGLDGIWVYDDGIVKGLIRIDGEEIKTLYVDHFFQSMGIGAKLLDFACRNFPIRFLWAIEKNTRAIAFYERHGFHKTGIREFEEGTTEYLIRLER